MKNLRVIAVSVMFATLPFCNAALTVDGGVSPQKMALDKAQQAYDAIVANKKTALDGLYKSDPYKKASVAFDKAAADTRRTKVDPIQKKLESLVSAALVEFDKPVTDARAAVENAQKALDSAQKAFNAAKTKHSSKDVQSERQKVALGVQQSPAYVDLVKQSKAAAADAEKAVTALPEKVALDKMVSGVSDSFTKQLSAAKEKLDAAQLSAGAPAPVSK